MSLLPSELHLVTIIPKARLGRFLQLRQNDLSLPLWSFKYSSNHNIVGYILLKSARGYQQRLNPRKNLHVTAFYLYYHTIKMFALLATHF